MALLGNWTVNALIQLNFASFIAGMARIRASLGAAQMQMGAFQKSAMASNAAIVSSQKQVIASSAAMKTALGTGMVVAGAGLLAFVGASTKAAADLQTAVLGLDIKAGGASALQKTQLANLLPRLAHETGIFDQTTAASFLGTLLGTGFSAGQLLGKGLSGDTIADQFAKFADARYRLTGEKADVSGQAIAAMAHQFGAYLPEQVGPMLESLNRITTSLHVPLQQLQRQTSYFASDITQNKIPWNDVVGMINVLQPMGLMSGRGGTGVDMMIRDLTAAPKMTGSLGATRNAAMRTLGLFDANNRSLFMDSRGQYHLQAAIDKLIKDRETMSPDAFRRVLTNAFPSANALRTAAAITDPMRRAQAEVLARKEAGVPSISVIQQLYLDTLQGALGQFATDFRTLMSRLITPAFLKTLTVAVQAMDNLTASLTDLFVRFPWAATATALAMTTAGLGLLFGGIKLLASGPLREVSSVLERLFTPFVRLLGPMRALLIPLGDLIVPLGLLAVAIGGVAFAFNYFKARPVELGTWLAKIHSFFIYEFIPGTKALFNTWSNAILGSLANFFKDLYGFVNNPFAWKAGFGAYLKTVDKAYAAQAQADNDHAFLVRAHSLQISRDIARQADGGEYGAHVGRPAFPTSTPRGPYALPPPAPIDYWEKVFAPSMAMWAKAFKPADVASESFFQASKNIRFMGGDIEKFFEFPHAVKFSPVKMNFKRPDPLDIDLRFNVEMDHAKDTNFRLTNARVGTSRGTSLRIHPDLPNVLTVGGSVFGTH